MSEPYPSRLLDRFVIRLPDGMRERIAELAKSSGRSMNAEIVVRLERSLKGNDLVLPAPVREALVLAAQENGRSVGDEILERLLATLAHPEVLGHRAEGLTQKELVKGLSQLLTIKDVETILRDVVERSKGG